MRRVSATACAALFAVTLACAGCGGPENEGGAAGGAAPGGNVVRVTGNISSAESWDAAKVRVVEGGVVVYSTLTIQPGTIVKFEPGSSLSTAGSGAIVADGTAAERIAFTSIKDDSRGGDSNGDGGATAPSRGDWDGIVLGGANGSVFRNCDFACSGDSEDGGKGSALDLRRTDRTVVEGCIFSTNDGGDPDDARGALGAETAGADTVIRGNIFYGNNVPLSIAPAVRVDPDNRFSDPANPSRTNRHNGIFVAGGDLTAPAHWTSTSAPYVVRARLDVYSTLSIGPGAVVKLAHAAWIQTANGGTVIADGTAASRVVFTSIRDDARGGDTNGDGNASTASPGDWDAVMLNGANGSIFRGCEFRFGGWNGHGALQLERSAGTTVDGCTFAENRGDALDAAFAGAGTVIRNNAFFANDVPLSISEKFDVDDSNVFHDPANPARKNRRNGISILPGDDLFAPVRWSATEVPFVIERTFRLYDTLMLSAGVVLKFEGGTGIAVQNRSGGAISGWAGAQFTSLRDDARLGDTNGDGDATVPGWGDWDGIWLEAADASGFGYAGWPNIFYDSH